MDFVTVEIGNNSHRVARPVADELGIADGAVFLDGDPLLDRIIELNRQLINSRLDRLRELSEPKQ